MSAATPSPLLNTWTAWADQPLAQRVGELGVALLILLGGWWLSRRLVKVLDGAMRRAGVDDILRAFLRNVASVLMLLVVFIAALQKTGLVPTASLMAVLGAAGLAIALALKDSLANIASGVMLIALRPFKAGDAVRAGGMEGVVEQVRIFHTRLRTYNNEVIVLPNSEVTGKPIVNLTGRQVRRLDLTVGIDYATSIADARALLLRIAADDAGALDKPAPAVLTMNLGDSAIELSLRTWVKTPDLVDARSRLLEAIHREFDAAGIRIPFPQRELHVYHKGAEGQFLADVRSNVAPDDDKASPTPAAPTATP